jgi:putative transposase
LEEKGWLNLSQVCFAALPPDVRKVSDFPPFPTFDFGAPPQFLVKINNEKFRVSRDRPCLYMTAVAKDRLPVFRTDNIKIITCQAIDQARSSCGFLVLAYVLMPNHLHLVTDGPRQPSEVLRFVKGTIAHDVLEYLKQRRHQESLRKLRHEEWRRHHRYSLWGHESNVFSIFSESMLMQKLNYLHQNPVRAGLVERVIDYRWSSARVWRKCAIDNEPLAVDFNRIEWRKSFTGHSPLT